MSRLGDLLRSKATFAPEASSTANENAPGPKNLADPKPESLPSFSDPAPGGSKIFAHSGSGLPVVPDVWTRRLLAWDSETHRFSQGNMAPKPVLFSFCRVGGQPWLMLANEASVFLESALKDPNVIHVLHNGPYDWAVLAFFRPHLLPLIIQAYEEGRVRDTQLRQELIDIREGRRQSQGGTYAFRKGSWVRALYSLAALEDLHLNRDRSAQKGEDTWRVRYHELEGIPLYLLPAEAVHYALDDAEGTLNVFLSQDGGRDIPNELEQNQAALALHFSSVYGMRVDPQAVANLEVKVTADYSALQRRMLEMGLYKIKKCTAEEVREGKADFFFPKQTRVTKKMMKEGIQPEFFVEGVGFITDHETQVPHRYAKDTEAIKARVVAAYRALNEPVPMTDTGEVSTDRDTLEYSGDEILEELAGGGPITTIKNTFLPTLKQGLTGPIHTRYSVVLNTGRIASSKPNLNNLPRKGGVRECFVPEAGHDLISVDYDTAELRSWGQVTFRMFNGNSDTAAFYRNEPDGDPHLDMAAAILGITTEEAKRRKKLKCQTPKELKDVEGCACLKCEITDVRQMSKALDFGLPGGMGVERLIESARKGYGVILYKGRNPNCETCGSGGRMCPTCEKTDAIRLREKWRQRWREAKPYFDNINRIANGSGVIEQFHPEGKPHRVRSGVGFCDGANTLFQGLTADGAKHALWNTFKECYLDSGTALYGCRIVAFLYDEILLSAPKDRASDAGKRLAKVMCDSMQKWLPDIPVRASPARMERWYKGADPVWADDGTLLPWQPS